MIFVLLEVPIGPCKPSCCCPSMLVWTSPMRTGTNLKEYPLFFSLIRIESLDVRHNGVKCGKPEACIIFNGQVRDYFLTKLSLNCSSISYLGLSMCIEAT